MAIADILEKYPWALNPLKLVRAVEKAGPGATEEAIKALYISYAGALLADTAADLAQRAKYFPIARKAAEVLEEKAAKLAAKEGSKKGATSKDK